MGEYILAWQLLKKQGETDSFLPIGGGAITLLGDAELLEYHPSLQTAIDITNLNIKESLNEYHSHSK